MNRALIFGITLTVSLTLLTAEEPEWLTQRPISDQFFYGRGEGATAEEAEASSVRDMLQQLGSQVNGVIREQNTRTGGKQEISRKLETFFFNGRLRTAELEDRFTADGRHHALMRYPENDALVLTRSAIMRYSDEYSVDMQAVIDQLDDGAMIRAARMEGVLHDAVSSDYGTDLTVSLRGNTLMLQVLNFAAFTTDLAENQRRGLEVLSASLLNELERLNYGAVVVEGHANPTGIAGEEENLMSISLARAETMAAFLRQAGFTVTAVRGIGGARPLGDVDSQEGRGLNRRVDIKVEIAP